MFYLFYVFVFQSVSQAVLIETNSEYDNSVKEQPSVAIFCWVTYETPGLPTKIDRGHNAISTVMLGGRVWGKFQLFTISCLLKAQYLYFKCLGWRMTESRVTSDS